MSYYYLNTDILNVINKAIEASLFPPANKEAYCHDNVDGIDFGGNFCDGAGEVYAAAYMQDNDIKVDVTYNLQDFGESFMYGDDFQYIAIAKNGALIEVMDRLNDIYLPTYGSIIVSGVGGQSIKLSSRDNGINIQFNNLP